MTVASRDNRRIGRSVEEYVAEQRDGVHEPDAWFDVTDDGTPVEVKSTEKELQSGRRGRFRLWLNQHRNLADHGGEYHMVLRDGDSSIAETTLSPEDVDEIKDQHGLKWAASGHADKGRQLKVSWAYVFPDRV